METNTNNSYSDEIEIDLGEVLLLLWHYIWLIFLCAIAAGVIGFCISKFAITPLYQSSTQIYIMNEKDSNTALTYSDLQMGSQLTKDYAVLVKSRTVLEKVISNLQLEETHESLASRIEVSNVSDTRILRITVTDPDPLWAQSIADEVRSVASDHIMDVMGIEAVNIVDFADLPELPSSPSVKKWVAIAFVIGAFICIAVLLIRFLLDDTVKSSEDVEKYLGMSMLAMIPMMDEQGAQKEKARQEKIIKSSAEAGVGESREPEPTPGPEENGEADGMDDMKVEELSDVDTEEEDSEDEPVQEQTSHSGNGSNKNYAGHSDQGSRPGQGNHSGQGSHSGQNRSRKGRR